MAIFGTFALRAFAALVPSNHVWGLDDLHAWPIVGGLLVTAFAAAGFVPAMGAAIERGLIRVGVGWQRHPVLGDVAVAIAVAALLFGMRDPIRFVGDSGMRVGALAANLPAGQLFAQSYPADRLVNVTLARSGVLAGADPGTALHLVGALVGGTFTLLVLAFLRARGATAGALPVAAVTLLGSSVVIHFAGYDKFGPLLVAIALIAAGAARLGAGKSSVSSAALVAGGGALAVAAHRSGYLLLPAALLILAQALVVERHRGRRVAITVAMIGVVAGAAWLLPRTLELFRTLDRTEHLSAAGATGARRLEDAMNLLFLFVPLWPAAVVAGVMAMRQSREHRARGFSLAPAALVAALPQLATIVWARGIQAPARDWDMYAPAGAVLGFIATAMLVSAWRVRPAGALAPALTTALAAGIATWGTHAIEPIASRRIARLIEGRPAWTDAQRARAYDYLGTREIDRGRLDRAAEYLRRAIALAPNPRFYYEAALAEARRGRLADARALALEAARRDPAKTDSWWLLVELARAQGDTASGRAWTDSLKARGARAPSPRGRSAAVEAGAVPSPRP